MEKKKALKHLESFISKASEFYNNEVIHGKYDNYKYSQLYEEAITFLKELYPDELINFSKEVEPFEHFPPYEVINDIQRENIERWCVFKVKTFCLKLIPIRNRIIKYLPGEPLYLRIVKYTFSKIIFQLRKIFQWRNPWFRYFIIPIFAGLILVVITQYSSIITTGNHSPETVSRDYKVGDSVGGDKIIGQNITINKYNNINSPETLTKEDNTKTEVSKKTIKNKIFEVFLNGKNSTEKYIYVASTIESGIRKIGVSVKLDIRCNESIKNEDIFINIGFPKEIDASFNDTQNGKVDYSFDEYGQKIFQLNYSNFSMPSNMKRYIGTIYIENVNTGGTGGLIIIYMEGLEKQQIPFKISFN